MDFTQGEIRTQKSLFPQYLDDYIEPDSYVRVVEAYVESLDMKTLEFKKSQPHMRGRPMYSPKGMLKNIQACLNCPCKCTVARYKVFEVTMKKGKFSKEYDEADMDLKASIHMP